MLANTIQLTVNTATPANDVLLTRYAEQPNRSDYIISGHTTAARYQCQVYRSFPKKNGNSLGVRKFAVKYTKDITVVDALGNDVVMPIIGEVVFSVPEGATDGNQTAMLNTLIGVLGSGSLLMTPLRTTLEI